MKKNIKNLPPLAPPIQGGNRANKKIWQTGVSLDPLVEKFTVGKDYLTDQKLIPYDVKASLAHAKMLNSIGILNKSELSKLEKGLKEILKIWEGGKFKISPSQEDCHTAIEQYLSDKFGEAGKKIHTGRSRNDQALVMMRLFMKDKLKEMIKLNKKLVQAMTKKARSWSEIPMPGYTHMQKAMPTTLGVWLGSYTHALMDAEISLNAVLKQIDQNPLGSAAGFGIDSLDLDKIKTTKILGFKRLQASPMYCAMSRGLFENIVLQSISQIMLICSKFANDMIFFTTQECSFLSLPDKFVTGSSIMPQKKNYDLFEIMRANFHAFSSYQSQIQGIVSSLGSGYHRDYQLTKKSFVDGVELCEITLNLMIKVIPALKANKKNLEEAMTDDLYATEKVYELVAKGVSFRDAYQEIKKKL